MVCQSILTSFLSSTFIIFCFVELHWSRCEAIVSLGEDDNLLRGFDNALPEDLLNKVKEELLIVQSKTSFLEQGTVFFSFQDANENETKPRNFIELSVKLFYQQYTTATEKSKIIGGEWWTQTKTEQQGLVFHYDKDEGHYQKFHEVKYPLISTITYLNDIGCPTLILNQTKDEESQLERPLIPHEAFISYPKFNRHVNFCGQLNHGIATSLSLSNDGSKNDQTDPSLLTWAYNWLVGVEAEKRRTFLINWWDRKPDSSKSNTISDQGLLDVGLFYPKQVQVYYDSINFKKSFIQSKEDKDLSLGVVVKSVSLHIDSNHEPQRDSFHQNVEIMPRGDGFYFDLPPHNTLSNRTLYQIKWGKENVYGTVTILDLSNPMIMNAMLSTPEPKFLLFNNENRLEQTLEMMLPIAKGEDILGKSKIYVSAPLKSEAAMKFFGIEQGMSMPVLVVDDLASRGVKQVLWENDDKADLGRTIQNKMTTYLHNLKGDRGSEL